MSETKLNAKPPSADSSFGTVLLARHGKSTLNAEKRISGQSDAPLTEKGRRQAERLALALDHQPLAAIYCSTLRRAIATAEPIATRHALSAQRCDDLKEMSHGIFDGRYRDQRDPQAQQYWRDRKDDPLSCRAPGGENLFDLEQRVAPCVKRIVSRAKGQTVLIVAHRNTNRVILRTLMRLTIEEAVGFGMHCGELYEIVTGAQPRLQVRPLYELISASPTTEVRP